MEKTRMSVCIGHAGLAFDLFSFTALRTCIAHCVPQYVFLTLSYLI